MAESMDFKWLRNGLAGYETQEVPSESEKEELKAQQKINMEADKIIEILRQIKDEYDTKNTKMEKTLDQLGTLNHLSGSAKVQLSETVEMLQKSCVVDTNRTNFFLQKAKMTVEALELAEKKRDYQRSSQQRCNSLEKRTQELMRDMQAAREEYEEFKENAEGKVIDTQYIQHQVDKQKKELVKLQAEAERLGLCDSDLRVIRERVEAIAQMKAESNLLKQEMEQYAGLPPNIEKAEEMLTGIVRKYEQKDQQLRTQIKHQSSRTANMMSCISQQAARSFK